MARLYYLDYASGTKETGDNFPQVQKIFPELDYNNKRSIYRLFEQGERFNDLMPIIECAELSKGSKLCDFLSSSMFNLNGFLISDRAKRIFDSFVLPPSKSYEIPIRLHNSALLHYYWLHMLFTYNNVNFKDIQNQYIIYNRSSFWTAKYSKEKDQITVTSNQDLKEKEDTLELGTYIIASVLFLKTEYLTQVPDVFKMPVLNPTEWIIKENVKRALEENMLTGFVVKEIDNLFFV